MTTAPMLSVHLPDADATTELGHRLAAVVGPGDTLLLHGDLGSGKTHLARALIQWRLAQAGRSEDIPSPTFTLVQTYDAGDVEIWHADLYRLGSVDEVIELGLDEAMRQAVVIVEWPDRLGAMAPEDALHMTLTQDGDGRRAEIRWSDDRLSALAAA